MFFIHFYLFSFEEKLQSSCSPPHLFHLHHQLLCSCAVSSLLLLSCSSPHCLCFLTPGFFSLPPPSWIPAPVSDSSSASAVTLSWRGRSLSPSTLSLHVCCHGNRLQYPESSCCVVSESVSEFTRPWPARWRPVTSLQIRSVEDASAAGLDRSCGGQDDLHVCRMQKCSSWFHQNQLEVLFFFFFLWGDLKFVLCSSHVT